MPFPDHIEAVFTAFGIAPDTKAALYDLYVSMGAEVLEVFAEVSETVASPSTLRPEDTLPIREKIVDFRYPSESGIQGELTHEGYRVAWCSESQVSGRVDLEGWEVVAANRDGVLTTFRLRTKPEDQLLLKKFDHSALVLSEDEWTALEVGMLNAVAVAAGWPDSDGSAFLDNYLRVTRRAKAVVRKVFGD